MILKRHSIHPFIHSSGYNALILLSKTPFMVHDPLYPKETKPSSPLAEQTSLPGKILNSQTPRLNQNPIIIIPQFPNNPIQNHHRLLAEHATLPEKINSQTPRIKQNPCHARQLSFPIQSSSPRSPPPFSLSLNFSSQRLILLLTRQQSPHRLPAIQNSRLALSL
ncbi:hypothetical protein VTK26DRAFT_1617 [Humicola hyalothermophila]